ncbi:MAG TPA: sugar phosphate isomerase/epimerase, partial [Verrucomicrobiae bacterium]|nr:sugar phosphate isomerase/epimerase [Verrucomicrobiae bacterium]
DGALRKVRFAATALLAGAALVAGCALFHPHIFKTVAGLQLYSVRDQMAKDVPGTLAEVHAWGIKYVELAGTYGLATEQFKAQLTEHGLDAVSGHFSFKEWSENPEGVLFQAKDLGLVDVGCAWIDHSGPFDEKTCRHAIEVFNNAGALAALHHMHFFYHTHGYEFQPYKGGTLFDLLVRETNPANVKFEMDIFWVVHAGQDPVKLLKKYPDRWESLHLKDMRKGTPTGLLTGSSDVTNCVALGAGMIDLPAVLRAARELGVQWYFIEDESPVSEEQIPESLIYLRDLRR